MYNTLLDIFAEYPEITHKKLSSLSEERLHGLLGGSIPWLMETVKLDMLARGIIEKTPYTPVKLRLGTR